MSDVPSCARCEWFRAETRPGYAHIDDWCSNKIATLGTVLQTSKASVCRFFEDGEQCAAEREFHRSLP